ncbi:MAG: histidine kinase [Bacteroidota bacterium]
MFPERITRQHVYWIGQVLAWSAYGCMLATLYVINDKLTLTAEIRASIFLEAVAGLFLTHGYRYFVTAYQWKKKPIGQLMILVFLSNIALAAIFFIINLIIYKAVNVTIPENITSFMLISSLMNHSVLFLIWSATYFASGFFNDYRRGEIEHLRWEGAIKDFELNKLKSQLNPHFVFNALNSIRSLVEEDPEKAKKSITQLSNILRNSLIADRSKFISLEEEMKTVNDYLNLERLRYEERLQVFVNLETESLAVPVPPMMIQTIVENAVKHGISQQVENGFIAIAAVVRKRMLEVSIRNSGVFGSSTKSGTGFGLLNTRQRLELLYGPVADFSITQEGDNTVLAVLSVPAKSMGDTGRAKPGGNENTDNQVNIYSESLQPKGRDFTFPRVAEAGSNNNL